MNKTGGVRLSLHAAKQQNNYVYKTLHPRHPFLPDEPQLTVLVL